ncbi:MAG: hypothetical protein HY855_00355 [Burkholderiales bacterium]|nr:hypothetical protein [Burkholderiales bacterium]
MAWVAQAAYLACLLGLLLLPAHRYGWMRELDPGFSGPLPEDGSGNRAIAAGLLLAGCWLAQAVVALAAARHRTRWFALGLAALAGGVWVLRFGGA